MPANKGGSGNSSSLITFRSEKLSGLGTSAESQNFQGLVKVAFSEGLLQRAFWVNALKGCSWGLVKCLSSGEPGLQFCVGRCFDSAYCWHSVHLLQDIKNFYYNWYKVLSTLPLPSSLSRKFFLSLGLLCNLGPIHYSPVKSRSC